MPLLPLMPLLPEAPLVREMPLAALVATEETANLDAFDEDFTGDLSVSRPGQVLRGAPLLISGDGPGERSDYGCTIADSAGRAGIGDRLR
jgi:hypothetical protein